MMLEARPAALMGNPACLLSPGHDGVASVVVPFSSFCEGCMCGVQVNLQPHPIFYTTHQMSYMLTPIFYVPYLIFNIPYLILYVPYLIFYISPLNNLLKAFLRCCPCGHPICTVLATGGSEFSLCHSGIPLPSRIRCFSGISKHSAPETEW